MAQQYIISINMDEPQFTRGDTNECNIVTLTKAVRSMTGWSLRDSKRFADLLKEHFWHPSIYGQHPVVGTDKPLFKATVGADIVAQLTQHYFNRCNITSDIWLACVDAAPETIPFFDLHGPTFA